MDGELESTKIKLPAPEDLLLALCIHGSKHLWERLAWIADIAGLIESQPSLKWNELVNRARVTGSERMLFLGLRLAGELLNANVPAEVKAAEQADVAAAGLAQEVARDLFTTKLTPSGMSGYFLFQMKARRRLRDKLKYLQFAFTGAPETSSRAELCLLPREARTSDDDRWAESFSLKWTEFDWHFRLFAVPTRDTNQPPNCGNTDLPKSLLGERQVCYCPRHTGIPCTSSLTWVSSVTRPPLIWRFHVLA